MFSCPTVYYAIHAVYSHLEVDYFRHQSGPLRPAWSSLVTWSSVSDVIVTSPRLLVVGGHGWTSASFIGVKPASVIFTRTTPHRFWRECNTTVVNPLTPTVATLTLRPDRVNPVWHRMLYSCTHNYGNSGRRRVLSTQYTEHTVG